MNGQARMSPLTALFTGIWVLGVVIIGAATTITLYAMRMVDGKVSAISTLAGKTIEDLPELVDSLQPALDSFAGRRAPEYLKYVKVDVDLVKDERTSGRRAVLSITNDGDDVISMLAVRVAALDGAGSAVHEWTEVVATPLAIDDDWRGVLMPHATRHIVLHPCRWSTTEVAGEPSAVHEISEIRVSQKGGLIERTVSVP